MEIKRPHLSLKEMGFVAKTAIKTAIPAAVAFAQTIPAFAQEYSPAQILNQVTQCGGELNGDDYPSNHVLLVGIQSRDGQWTGIDLGPIWGQCGNRGIAGDDTISPFPTGVEQGQPVSVGDSRGITFLWTRTYPQCGGTLGVLDYDPAHTIYVHEFQAPSGELTYGTRNLGPRAGECGNS
jgi:hypothetical protein